KCVIKNHITYSRCCSHCERIASKSGTMCTWTKMFDQIFFRSHRTDWHSIPKSFCQSENIWFYVVMLKGEFFSGTTHAGLDFIYYYLHVLLFAKCTEALNKCSVSCIYSAFTLHHFYHYGCSVFIS